MSRFDEIKGRCDFSTHGPWRASDTGHEVITEAFTPLAGRTHGYGCRGNFVCSLNDGENNQYADPIEQLNTASFIANSREDVPWLVAEVERLTAELETAKADILYAMENSDSLLSCKPCTHRGYDPEDGLFCKLNACRPEWRGPCAENAKEDAK